MSSGESQNSQAQFHQSQIALAGSSTSSSLPSSHQTNFEYCYPSSIIGALQAGSGTHRYVSSTIPRSTLEFGPVTGQGDFIGQAQVSRNTPYSGENVSSVLSSDPGPSLFSSQIPAQHRGDLPSSNFSEARRQLTVGDPRMREYGMSTYPIAMGEDAYLTGQMPQNTSMSWNPSSTIPADLIDVWPNRTSRPLQSSATMDQQNHLFSSPGYMGYNPQRSNSEQNYYQSGRPSAQYLSSHPGQQPLRSHSMSYVYPSSSIAGSPPLSEQSIISNSPNYILNQPDYYFPETSSIPSNTCSMSVSPQPQPSTIYSSPEPTRTSSEADPVRVISSRPRPQCWDHGCNGREFSTFSNLLRHQREKSGAVAKAECPICGAVFTRSTARNIHVSQGKCKSGGGGADGGRY